ncbi:hypothetical protein RN001_004893 [Aquatica leii]|uniref:Cilia- and flagella-associated protein 43 n=1 Tax=Aquatica leii TaxID=1421715 RepID=A0AAN7PBY7_9COLE|nr:hypothetical protein RN001_004893 [Aquatica leii]
MKEFLIGILVFTVISSNFSHKLEVPIGGIFEGLNENEEIAFRVAIDIVNKNENLPYTLVPIIGRIEPDDVIDAKHGFTIDVTWDRPFSALEIGCSILSKGVVGIFNALSEDNSNTVQSLCDEKEIPVIQTIFDTEHERDCCSINLYPHAPILAKAFADVVKRWNWDSFTIIYEDQASLAKVTEMLKIYNTTGHTVVLRQLYTSGNGDFRKALKDIWRSGQKNIVLDCSTENLNEVLKQAQQVGLMTHEYNYIIINLDMHTIDLGPYQYGETNITGLRLVNPLNPLVIEVAEAILQKRTLMKLHVESFDPFVNAWQLQIKTALMVDAVMLFSQALHNIGQFNAMPLLCNSSDNWIHGETAFNFMKTENRNGLTGFIQFDNLGVRSDFDLDLIELKEGGITNIGNWNSRDGLNISRIIPEIEETDKDSLQNKSFIVIIALTPPYAMLKESKIKLTGNDRFEGFGIDLISELANLEGFNYTFIVRLDKQNGDINNATGRWTGLIGDVIDGVADLAITDLTVNRKRQSAVDFTSPFMDLGIQILYAQPTPAPPSFFTFASPFAVEVWLLLGGAYFGVSLALFVMARLCHSEWTNPYPCIEEPEYLINQFSLRNSLWFTLGGLMQQGADIAPIGLSTRLLTGFWWFFTLIMVSSYTANLAAFLTTEVKELPFTTVEELVKRADKLGITYGAKKGGATYAFFKGSDNDLYKDIGNYMDSHPEVMVKENEDGEALVEKGNYAFFMESTSISYAISGSCNLASVGNKLDEKNYAIAMRQDSTYRGRLSAAVLKLKETGKIDELQRKWWLEKRKKPECEESDEIPGAPPLNLKHVGGIFWVSVGGSVLAFFLVFTELGLHTLKKYGRDRQSCAEEFKDEIKHYFSFKDKDSMEDYLQLVFTENDFLITLNDDPSYVLIVWNWRNGTKIHSVNSNIYGTFQTLRCSLSNPIFLAQMQTGCNVLNLWDVNMCGRVCIIDPHRVSYPDDCGVFTDSLWTYEGGLLVLDINEPNYSLSKIIEWDNSGNVVPTFCWYKGGIAIAGPDGIIKHFKKTGTWVCVWTVTPPMPFSRLISNSKETLVGKSTHGDILYYSLTNEKFNYVVENEGKINDVCIIYPTGQYFVTLQHNHEVASWSVETGERQDVIELTGKAISIKENPDYPYVGVGYSHGVLELLSLYDPKHITSMTTFNLSKNPLNSIYFTEFSKLIIAADTISGEFFILEGIPGTKINILYRLESNRQICDYVLVASRTCLRLFVIYVTSKYYIAGDKIARYCVIKGKPDADCKVYDLESQSQMYTKIYATKKPNRDRCFYVTPITTKKIHELSTKRADPVARLTDTIDTEHQMKKIQLHFDQHHIISFAYDGLVIIRNLDFVKQAVIMPHYRNSGGIIKAYVDPHGKYVISLGRDNTLVCNSLTNVEIDETKEKDLSDLLESERFQILFTQPTYGLAPTGELEGKTWAEVDQINREIRERIQCAQERHDILLEFVTIRHLIKQLLTKNLEGPDNEKLDIQCFNLDTALKEEKTLKSQEECKRTKQYLEALIVAQDQVSNWIKDFCWNPMKVQGQDTSAILENWVVENYALHKQDSSVSETRLNLITELRNLETQMAKKDSLEPWIPKTKSEINLLLEKKPQLGKDETGPNLLEVLEAEENVETEARDVDTETAFLGSVSHNFVKLSPCHYTQFQVQSFLQTDIARQLNLVKMKKVKEHFNVIFKDITNQKVREMTLIEDRNARLRHIISELNYFSTDKLDIIITNPPWLSSENPDSILTVQDNEIGTTPYISPSEQAILDAKAAEAERIRLLLLADDFRERALVAMMNGVLEVRWEDELRKEVPLPRCMTDKTPEEYNEDDIRATREYEEAVKFLHSERERYKKLLEVEYGKIGNNIRDGIKKFNKKLEDTFLTKLLAESSIKQESLKMSRQALTNHNRILLNKAELDMVSALKQNEETINKLNTTISMLQNAAHGMRINLDTLLAREKALEKMFKKEFADASSVVQEQTIKLYKKRPKANVRNITTVALTLETAKALITQEKSILLTTECFDYLKSVDAIDLYVNVPPAVDENYFAIVCKHRRLKIEIELKIRAVQIEIQEGEYTMSLFEKYLNQEKDLGQKLQINLEQIRNTRLHLCHNIEIQLVLKQGIVEIPQAGSINDFNDAIMINRSDVETINRIIIKGGKKKIKAMKDAMNFRRNIIAMEWEHRRLQMQIQDLQTNYQEVNAIQVTKDIQNYLKFKAKGFPLDRGTSFEDEIEMQKATFEKIIQEKKDKVKELQDNINTLKKKNHSLDKQITAINVDVCEFQLDRDTEMEQRKKDIIKIRMKILVRRANLIKEIQKNHSDILMLQTELELLRLKTFPTLTYALLP